MKIAAITDDGKTISQHFGRAPYYRVLTIENGQVVHSELRPKLGHAQFSDQQHGHTEQGQPHGFGAAAEQRHARMAEAILDCEALLCRGMGMGAYQSMQANGIRPVVTDIPDIQEAAAAYVQGRLVDHIELLH